MVVTEAQTGTSSSQILLTFQIGTLTTAQRATIVASGQEPSFVSEWMRESIAHGGASTGSQCSSALTVGTASFRRVFRQSSSLFVLFPTCLVHFFLHSAHSLCVACFGILCKSIPASSG